MQTELIIELAERNGGVVTASMAHEAGVDRSLLRHLCRTGRLECVERGVYAMPESWIDEPYIAQIRFGRGVFSHNTALWLHGLSDRTPDTYDMTFPRGYNTTSARRAGIAARTACAGTYGLGVDRVTTPFGHEVLAYCAERSICDTLSARSRTDVRTPVEALRTYVSSSGRDIPKLAEYARTLGVDGRLARYLEVLL